VFCAKSVREKLCLKGVGVEPCVISRDGVETLWIGCCGLALGGTRGSFFKTPGETVFAAGETGGKKGEISGAGCFSPPFWQAGVLGPAQREGLFWGGRGPWGLPGILDTGD